MHRKSTRESSATQTWHSPSRYSYDDAPIGIFQECIGFFKKLEFTEFKVVVVLERTHGPDIKMAFPASSPEADVLVRELNVRLIGKKIGMLRTDESENPIRIRRC